MRARVSRRTVIASAGASLLSFGIISAFRSSTPTAPLNDLSGLEQQLEETEPTEIVAKLSSSTVTSSLFPPEIGPLRTVPWHDDADVEGAEGAFQVLGSGEYRLIGAYVVYPESAAATTMLETYAASTDAAGPATVAGLPAAGIGTMLGPVTLVQAGPVLVWGFAMPSQAEAAASSSAPDLERLRKQATTFAEALLDHLQSALT